MNRNDLLSRFNNGDYLTSKELNQLITELSVYTDQVTAPELHDFEFKLIRYAALTKIGKIEDILRCRQINDTRSGV